MTDWYVPCAYNPEIKQRFHTAARRRLRRLATALGFPPGSFDLRSNLLLRDSHCALFFSPLRIEFAIASFVFRRLAWQLAGRPPLKQRGSPRPPQPVKMPQAGGPPPKWLHLALAAARQLPDH